jgi:hypothetical protein
VAKVVPAFMIMECLCETQRKICREFIEAELVETFNKIVHPC